MTVVTLNALLHQRDESLKVQPRARRIHIRMPAIPITPVLAALVRFWTFIIRTAIHHGLVLSGCTAVVISAAMVAPVLGWLVTGLALFFLEARRR
jgi:hypothetical protein